MQSPSALQGVLASFSSLFRFYGPRLNCFGSVSALASTSFPTAVSSEKALINPTADRQSQRLAGDTVVDHLAAKEMDIFL